VLKLFANVPVIDRPGFISAWDDPAFVAAIEKTGRKNLIMAGVTIDVCLAFAATQAIDAGYNMYGVVDASGPLEVTIRENAVARMKDHGIMPINWTTVAAELQRNWTLPTGQDLGRVFHDHYQSFGLLMDSFESTAANARKKPSQGVARDATQEIGRSWGLYFVAGAKALAACSMKSAVAGGCET